MLTVGLKFDLLIMTDFIYDSVLFPGWLANSRSYGYVVVRRR